MLTGASVELTRQQPLGRRDLTETGRSELTLAAAVREMKRAFASVADVVAAAESVWNETADGLSEIGTQLAAAKEQLGDLGDDEVAGALAAAEDELGQLRERAELGPAGALAGRRGRHHPAGTAAQAGPPRRRRGPPTSPGCARTPSSGSPRPRRPSRRRQPPGRTPRPPGSGRTAKIADAGLPPLVAETAGLEARLAALDKLKAAGRWARLAAELDTIEAEAAAATQRCRECAAGGGRRSWAGAMSCAACWAPTRPRRRGWEPPRTPSSARSI